jgi:hypothetical protein
MRTVTVFSMNDNGRETLRTSATTWGQVKAESSAIRSMVKSDMKVVIKQTKAVIESEDTILPNDDVTIYLFPGKVKSGDNTESKIKELAEQLIDGFVKCMKQDMEETSEKLRVLQEASNTGDPLPF